MICADVEEKTGAPKVRIVGTERYRPLGQALQEPEELRLCYTLDLCTSDFAKKLKKLLPSVKLIK